MHVSPSQRAGVRRVAIVAGALAASLSPARAAEVFNNLPGSWSGGGTAVLQDGSSERIRCRVKYAVAPSGTVVHQELDCASDSYKINMRSDILYQPDGGLKGTWMETGRQVNGSIVGKVDGDNITTKVSGLAFNADVAITTHNARQTIRIKSEGSYAKLVSIDLRSD